MKGLRLLSFHLAWDKNLNLVFIAKYIVAIENVILKLVSARANLLENLDSLKMPLIKTEIQEVLLKFALMYMVDMTLLSLLSKAGSISS